MFFINTLFKKTFFLIISIVMLVVLLFSYYVINNQKNALKDVLYSKANTISKSITLATSDAMVTEDHSYIVEHVQKVLEDNSEMHYVMIMKKNGMNIYNTSTRWSILDNLPSEIKALNNKTIVDEIFKNSFYDKEVYYFNYPIVFSGIKWGWIAISLSLEQYEKGITRIYQDSMLLVLGMLLGSILFSYILTKWLVQPILMLNEAAKKIALGDFTNKVKVDQEGELGELANSFNRMTNSLKESHQKLQNYNDKLEKRVQDRTEELNLLNQQLDQKVKEEVIKRVEQEQLLIQQSRFAAMGEMIGNIAHQWRQPLNALGLLMQNIEFAHENKILDDDYIKRAVDKSNKLTKSMSQTIDDFRNFFKPNKDKDVFSFLSAYESTMGMISSSLANNLIEIKEDIDKDVCVNGFTSEFSQVILNIINNAKDALVENTKENRAINISIYKDDKFAYFKTVDNAGGIPQSILYKIFDPYFTTKEEGKGTGIGLYMSKTIIENNMNGTLSVQNTEDGACFIIKIKLHQCEI